MSKGLIDKGMKWDEILGRGMSRPNTLKLEGTYGLNLVQKVRRRIRADETGTCYKG